MSNKFFDLEQELKKLKTASWMNMDSSSRKNTRVRILNTITVSLPIKQDVIKKSWLSLIPFRYAAVTFIIIFIFTATTAVAAQKAKPDDFLYPIKVVSEKIFKAVTTPNPTPNPTPIPTEKPKQVEKKNNKNIEMVEPTPRKEPPAKKVKPTKKSS